MPNETTERRVDLHVHTAVSDGSLSPTELVRLAAELGLAGVAITDHDTLDGVAEAQREGAVAGVEVVSGVEISVGIDLPTKHGRARSMHLLVYHLALDGALAARLRELQDWRVERNARLIDRLGALGIPVTMEEVRGAKEGLIGRPHFAAAMVKRGYVKDLPEAFERYLKVGRPAYLKKQRLSAEEAIVLARGEGAVPVVAHPGLLGVSDERLRRALEGWKALGLCGIEVDHSQHDEPYRGRLRRMAADLDLLCTGGSDFHGSAKPNIGLGSGRRGNVAVSERLLEQLLSCTRSSSTTAP